MILINNIEDSFFTLNSSGYPTALKDLPKSTRWLSQIRNICQALTNAEHNKEILFLYRGESRETFGRKTGLESDFIENPNYDRFFVIGSKAKSYYKDKKKDFLTIKQFDNNNKELYIFDSLNKLSKYNMYHNVLIYFNDDNNKNDFLNKFKKIHNKKERLTIQNFYLAFIHTLSSEPMIMKAHSVLLSSSRKQDVALSFAKNGFIVGFWLKQPINIQAIDYNNIADFYKLLDTYSFPNIHEINYPDESEVTVFSAIFPHNILFVYDINNNRHVFNPYIIGTNTQNIVEEGIAVDQTYFFEHIEDIYSHSIWRNNSELLYEK
jgi:hypothetical protein